MTLRKSPPPIETILSLGVRPDDAEYDFARTLNGIRGTWHRLWAALSTQESQMFGDDDSALNMYAEAVSTIRAEFEQKFGRSLTEGEFERLKADAKAHGDAVKLHFRVK